MSCIVPEFKKAIKRNRGELIDLDYYKVANVLISDGVLTDENHKKIKLSTSSDTAKMDSLLDTLELEAQQSTLAFQSLVGAVWKQNQSLAEKLQSDLLVRSSTVEACSSRRSEQPGIGEEEPIRIDESIFETDDEAILLSSAETFEANQSCLNNVAGANRSSNLSQDLFLDESCTQEIRATGTSTNANVGIHNFNDALAHQGSAITSFQFVIDTAWIKSIDTNYYYKGENMGYRGCPENLSNSDRICKAKVKPFGSDGKFICPKYRHINSRYRFIPLLKVMLQDQSAKEMEATLFGEDVETVLGIPAEQLEKLSHDELRPALLAVKSKLFSLRIKSKRVKKPMQLFTKATITWDNIASLTKHPWIIGSGI